MSRGKITLIAGTVLILIFSFYVWHDLNLSEDLITKNLPDVVVENLDFRRTIDGKDWHIQAEKAEHELGLIRALSMDVSMDGSNSSSYTRMHAVSGEFSQESANMKLTSLNGFVFFDNRSIDIKAAAANYNSTTDIWSFEQGIEVWDNDAHITGKWATITSGGIFSLGKGAYARWKID